MSDRKCAIYLIVSPSNGRYVGSSISIKKRFNRYKNCSCGRQTAIFSSLRKYGPENHLFKVLMYCEESERYFWERCFGDIYLALADFKNGLNITLPGYGDTPQAKTKEFLQKVSDAQKNRFKNPEERRRTSETTKRGFTEEVRREMSIIHKKRYENPLLREQRSQVRKEYYKRDPNALTRASESAKNFLRQNPEAKANAIKRLQDYHRANPDAHSINLKKAHERDPGIGTRHSEKMKNLYANRPDLVLRQSRTTKEYLRLNPHPLSKKVLDTETGEVFENRIAVAKRLGVPANTVGNWLRGKSPNRSSYKYL
jgi:group I intron endonuclease